MNRQNLNELFTQATQAHQRGQFKLAENLYKQLLVQFPDHADALHLLGITYSQQGNHEQALSYLQRAVELNPLPVYLNNLGECLRRKGEPGKAIEVFKQALTGAPDFAESYFNLANVYLLLDNPSEALLNFRLAIKYNPGHARAYFNLGNLMLGKADLNSAKDCYQKAININPGYAEAYNNIGIAFERLSEDKKNSQELTDNLVEQAAFNFRRAIFLAPDFIAAKANLAKILKGLDNAVEALNQSNQAFEKSANLAACLSLAKQFREKGDYSSAINYFEQALRLDPENAYICNDLALILIQSGRLDDGISIYHKALEIKPDYISAFINLAKVYEKPAKTDLAKKYYQQALALEPKNVLLRLYIDTLHNPIFFSSREIDRYQDDLSAKAESYQNMELNIDMAKLHESGVRIPLALVYHGKDDKVIREKFAAIFNNIFPRYTHRINRKKPKIGFVVTQEHEGIFVNSMRGILNNLSTEKFNLTIICEENARKKIVQPMIKNPLIKYLNLPATIDQAIEAIGNEQFDILYYWEVGTDVVNYFLPFCRLAPIQCTSWGWQVTTGIPQMDYYISSELLETEEADNFYSENLLRLQSLPVYYYKPPLPFKFSSKADFGFSEDDRIYFCPQNLLKIHPDFDKITIEILQRDPKAIYVLIEDYNPFVTQMLKDRFSETHKSYSGKIRFMPRRMSGPEYINLVYLADVMLDTIYYGGVNTSYDAFSVGTPVVTFPGPLQRARYTSALYRAMKITDCLVNSEKEYIALAVKIAGEPSYRKFISNKIIESNSILFQNINAIKELSDLFEKLVLEY